LLASIIVTGIGSKVELELLTIGVATGLGDRTYRNLTENVSGYGIGSRSEANLPAITLASLAIRVMVGVGNMVELDSLASIVTSGSGAPGLNVTCL
jgi:hypothetical protein